MTKQEILIYAEITKDNYVHTVVFELANKARELSQKLDNAVISAIISKPGLADKYREAFQKSGFDRVYAAENEIFANYSTEFYSKTATEIIKKYNPSIVLIGATTQGRDLAPRISGTLATGLTADCIELNINEKHQLAATRPTFGGKLMATILCKNLPQMATVRPRVFKPAQDDLVKNTEYIYITPELENTNDKVKVIDFVKSASNIINELDSAEIIAAGGRGLKNEEGFKLLKDFANTIEAAVGASRGAVDMGLAEHDIQIGQTGKTVAPKIYIAFGISGAIQHIVGMNEADKVIAVNTDKNAPIFEHCDCGIVADAFEILPKLTEYFKKQINEN